MIPKLIIQAEHNYMKVGLKKILNDLIKLKGEISINEVHDVCNNFHYKHSNAERQLRPSSSRFIISVKNDKGVVIAYRWNGLKLEQKDETKNQRTLLDHLKPTVRCNPWGL